MAVSVQMMRGMPQSCWHTRCEACRCRYEGRLFGFQLGLDIRSGTVDKHMHHNPHTDDTVIRIMTIS